MRFLETHVLGRSHSLWPFLPSYGLMVVLWIKTVHVFLFLDFLVFFIGVHFFLYYCFAQRNGEDACFVVILFFPPLFQISKEVILKKRLTREKSYFCLPLLIFN